MKTTLRLLASVAIVTLAACAPVNGGNNDLTAKLTSDHVIPLPMNVGSVAVTGVNTVATMSPNSKPGSEFGYDVGQMIKNYAAKRMVGNGTSSTKLLVEVVRADVAYNRDDPTNNVTKWLRVDGHDEYKLSSLVRITLQNDQGADQISTEIGLENSVSIPDNVSLARRDDLKSEFVEKYMSDLDARLTSILMNKFYVVVPVR